MIDWITAEENTPRLTLTMMQRHGLFRPPHARFVAEQSGNKFSIKSELVVVQQYGTDSTKTVGFPAR